MVVEWAERWTRFSMEGRCIHCIAGMASGVRELADMGLERVLVGVLVD